MIHNTSEHALWLNSAAMEMAGITDRPVADRDEERGVIRDASGHPTGVLLEAAMQIAARAGARARAAGREVGDGCRPPRTI